MRRLWRWLRGDPFWRRKWEPSQNERMKRALSVPLKGEPKGWTVQNG